MVNEPQSPRLPSGVIFSSRGREDHTRCLLCTRTVALREVALYRCSFFTMAFRVYMAMLFV